MIITVDGPAGVGKSTIAAAVGKNTIFRYINSGNLYRTITLALWNVFEENLSVLLENDQSTLLHNLDKISLRVDGEDIFLNNEKVNDSDIRNDIIEKYVAQLSSIPAIRNRVNSILHEIAQNQDIIVEGRDMSTVVFPYADVKIYLDADLDVRAERRFRQGTSEQNVRKIRSDIMKRDTIDREKAFGALKRSSDSTYLDTTGLTIVQVYEIVMQLIIELCSKSRY